MTSKSVRRACPVPRTYCFSIGYVALQFKAAPGGFGIPVVTGHTLLCLNLQDDAAYRAYLNSLHDGKTK